MLEGLLQGKYGIHIQARRVKGGGARSSFCTRMQLVTDRLCSSLRRRVSLTLTGSPRTAVSENAALWLPPPWPLAPALVLTPAASTCFTQAASARSLWAHQQPRSHAAQGVSNTAKKPSSAQAQYHRRTHYATGHSHYHMPCGKPLLQIGAPIGHGERAQVGHSARRQQHVTGDGAEGAAQPGRLCCPALALAAQATHELLRALQLQCALYV